jgi:DNA-binding NarL/FixJ family response regulator
LGRNQELILQLHEAQRDFYAGGFDEYVYDALAAGASGFLLKDSPPERLVTAIRVVAGAEALLAPSVTSRLIEQLARARGRHRTPPHGLDELTSRELEVFTLVARGLSNAEIAEALGGVARSLRARHRTGTVEPARSDSLCRGAPGR